MTYSSTTIVNWMLVVRRWMFSPPKNNKSLPNLSVEQGQMGDGSAPSSLSHADIRRAPFGGCQLPDAILHGKRSLRPRGRAVQRLAASGFRVRLFSLLELMVAPPACKPDERHVCDLLFASPPISTGSATVFDGAFARYHGVSPLHSQVAFAHSPAVSFFNIADAWKVFTQPARAVVSFPVRTLILSRLSAVFRLADSPFFCVTARVARPC